MIFTIRMLDVQFGSSIAEWLTIPLEVARLSGLVCVVTTVACAAFPFGGVS
jgi:hypothetical protein